MMSLEDKIQALTDAVVALTVAMGEKTHSQEPTEQKPTAREPKTAKPQVGDASPSKSDARAALLAVRKAHDVSAMERLIQEFANGALVFNEIPEKSYADLIAACEALTSEQSDKAA